MPLIDLTHPFTRNMPVYPGDRPPIFTEVAHVDKDGYNGVRLNTGMHIGTHMDAPLHMIRDGKKLNDYPVDHFTGKALCIHMQDMPVAGPDLLKGVDLQEAEILLFNAGWSKHFGHEKYYRDHPEIGAELARRLAGTSVRMIGLDFPSPDRTPYEVHRILLGNDILIIENLKDLDKLPVGIPFNIYAFPYTYDLEASPVRVIAGW